MRFYKCPICGNIITVVDGNAKNIKCCGREMEELVANTEDAALEKHVPVYEKIGDHIEVRVGEVSHPMVENHYIMFIAQIFGDNINIVKLKPGDEAKATFEYVSGAKVYEYCNLHGLWVTEVK